MPLSAQETEQADGDDIAEEAEEEDEVIIVQGTRLGRRVQDEPIRVEIIAGEEIEEKAIMRPGNIAMLVNETGGVRVQVSSPALGAANIRIQGLEGRYTQLLADNLPLYGGQAASLGVLQIPPTDLRQVEVIKGAASALYGPAALGGVINLISKRPGDEFEAGMAIVLHHLAEAVQMVLTHGRGPQMKAAEILDRLFRDQTGIVAPGILRLREGGAVGHCRSRQGSAHAILGHRAKHQIER